MKLFATVFPPCQSRQLSSYEVATKHYQTFFLEPVLPLGSIVDGLDDGSKVIDLFIPDGGMDIDLFDGGKHQGDWAIFSLEGMKHVEPGSKLSSQN